MADVQTSNMFFKRNISPVSLINPVAEIIFENIYFLKRERVTAFSFTYSHSHSTYKIKSLDHLNYIVDY